MPALDFWFDFASTSLSGLPFSLWVLELYLFIGITLLDVEWKSIGALRPRLILGGLALVEGVVADGRSVDRERPEEREMRQHPVELAQQRARPGRAASIRTSASRCHRD